MLDSGVSCVMTKLEISAVKKFQTSTAMARLWK